MGCSANRVRRGNSFLERVRPGFPSRTMLSWSASWLVLNDGAVDETSRQPPNHVRCEQTGVDDIRRMLLEGRAKPAYTGWQIPMTTEVQAALGDAEVLLRSGARSGPEPGLHLDGCDSERSHPPRILGRVRERLPRHVM